MNDLSVYETAWRDAASAAPKTNTQRLMARGAEWINVQLKSARVESYSFGSNLQLDALRFAKKSKKDVIKRAIFGDFSKLEHLKNDSDYLFSTLDISEDLRSTSEHLPPISQPYDSELATALPALVFHRLWQCTKAELKNNILFDAQISWKSGRISWNGSPLPWAWADQKNASFLPETRIDELFTFYTPNSPLRRRRFYHTTHHVDPVPEIHQYCEEARALANAPLCAMTPANIDAVILTPLAVMYLLKEILPSFASNAAGVNSFAKYFGSSEKDADPLCLGDSLNLSCNPAFEGFNLPGLPHDARGQCTQTVNLIQNGRATGFAASDVEAKSVKRAGANTALPQIASILKSLKPNGHAIDPFGKSEVFYPVLFGSGAYPAFEPGFAKNVAQRTLVIEEIRCVPAADTSQPSFIYLPEGGILYEDGLPIGVTPLHRMRLTLASLLRAASPASTPLVYNGMAACALSLDPSVLFS